MAYDITDPRDAFGVTQLGIQGLQGTGQQARGYASQLFDFSSPFYQNFRSYLGSVTPGFGTSQSLAGLRASGSNFAQGNVINKEREEAFNKQRQEFLNTTVRGFAAQNIGQGANLLGIAGQSYGNIGQLGLGLRQADIQQGAITPDFWDYLSAPLGAVSGSLTAGLFGGGAAAGASGFASSVPAVAASDIRLKENIEYTGEKTKDGIPVILFNYKGRPQRFRGVIAQDVEKVIPDAVIELNGVKYVDYGRL